MSKQTATVSKQTEAEYQRLGGMMAFVRISRVGVIPNFKENFKAAVLSVDYDARFR